MRTLRFQNFRIAGDFVDLPVELVVGDPKFIPGDRLLGQISSIADQDNLKFDGIKGMSLKIEFGVKSSKLRPRVQVIDPSGQIQTTLIFSNSETRQGEGLRPLIPTAAYPANPES